MILKVKPSPKSAGSKSSKDTYQKIGPQGKKPSIEAEGKRQEKDYRQAMDERTY
jgi:hypothetical protein